MKAVFLDLDWTLIRPKSFAVCADWIADDASEEDQQLHYEAKEKSLPKDAVDVQLYQMAEERNGVPGNIAGYMYRNTFPQNAKDWEFMPGILEALKPYVEEGCMLIIVSNQGGIDAGHQTEEEVRMKLSRILNELDVYLLGKKEAYYSRSLSKDDPWRKPNIGMLNQAVLHYGISLKDSLMIGDMDSDRQCAKNAGVSYMDIKEFLRTHAPR